MWCEFSELEDRLTSDNGSLAADGNDDVDMTTGDGEGTGQMIFLR